MSSLFFVYSPSSNIRRQIRESASLELVDLVCERIDGYRHFGFYVDEPQLAILRAMKNLRFFECRADSKRKEVILGGFTSADMEKALSSNPYRTRR